MIRRTLMITVFILTGQITTSIGLATTNTSMFKVFEQKDETIKIKIETEYLGNPLEGVEVAIIDNGRVLAKSTTGKKGKAKITIHDLGAKTVDLKLSKQGFKTQILSGLILVHKSKYEFSFEKGEGLNKANVETDIPNIEEESAKQIKKHQERMKKHQEKAKSYAKEIDEENQKRREIEKETAKINKELRRTQEDIRQIEKKLSSVTTRNRGGN